MEIANYATSCGIRIRRIDEGKHFSLGLLTFTLRPLSPAQHIDGENNQFSKNITFNDSKYLKSEMFVTFTLKKVKKHSKGNLHNFQKARHRKRLRESRRHSYTVEGEGAAQVGDNLENDSENSVVETDNKNSDEHVDENG